MSSTEIRNRLRELAQERVEAEAHGLATDEAYMADLEDEVASCRRAWRAYVVATVTEMAVLRADASARNCG